MRKEQFIFGIYYGLILSGVVFSLVVFPYLRDFNYLRFALMMASYGLFQLTINGLSIEYLWPHRVYWNMMAIPVFGSLAIALGVDFSWEFLSLRGLTVWAQVCRRIVVLGSVGIALLALAGQIRAASSLVSIMSAAAVPLLAALGVVSLLRGYRPARYYLLAGSAFLLGVMLQSLRNFSLLPSSLLTDHGNQIGSALLIGLLSLALVARFDSLREEQQRARELVIRSQQEAAENRRRSVELRLQALQAKINPHFLFNTLNTISGLIAEAPERAERMVFKLSRLFRHTLRASERELVPLGEEIAIVRAYLEIEQIRFGPWLSFDIRETGDTARVRLPGLTLQPLVENSLKHGLRPKVEGGHVLVTVDVGERSCRLSVEDDGVGMAPGAGHKGHGLSNVRERLRLVYGDAVRMTMSGGPGLRIEITFPVGSNP